MPLRWLNSSLLNLPTPWNPDCLLLGAAVSLLVTMFENNLIVAVVRWDSRPHTPIFFFFSSVTYPPLKCVIPPAGSCKSWLNASRTSPPSPITAVLFRWSHPSFWGWQCLLLAGMAYNRFVGISYLLHYTIIMNNRVCIQLALGIWTHAFLAAVTLIITIPASYY